VNYICEIPPGTFQNLISNGPIQECTALACWRLQNILSVNNISGLDCEIYNQLCQICGETGGQAKYYFISLILVEAFFGFFIFVLCNDLFSLDGRIIIMACCWLNGLMWLVGVEFFRCRQFSILPFILDNRCDISDITIPGRVFAILYFFLGFIMVYFMLMGDERECQICGEKYWAFLQDEHNQSHANDDDDPAFSKGNAVAMNPIH